MVHGTSSLFVPLRYPTTKDFLKSSWPTPVRDIIGSSPTAYYRHLAWPLLFPLNAPPLDTLSLPLNIPSPLFVLCCSPSLPPILYPPFFLLLSFFPLSSTLSSSLPIFSSVRCMLSIPTCLKVLSLNVWCLNSPEKRYHLLMESQNQGAHSGNPLPYRFHSLVVRVPIHRSQLCKNEGIKN